MKTSRRSDLVLFVSAIVSADGLSATGKNPIFRLGCSPLLQQQTYSPLRADIIVILFIV